MVNTPGRNQASNQKTSGRDRIWLQQEVCLALTGYQTGEDIADGGTEHVGGCQEEVGQADLSAFNGEHGAVLQPACQVDDQGCEPGDAKGNPEENPNSFFIIFMCI